MEINNKKDYILELCSEDAYGSWEFWSTKDNKTIEEAKQIIDTIIKLINEKKLVALEHKFNGPYKEVSLDVERLENEVKRSMHQSIDDYDVDPDTFYWFEATEEGSKEDLLLRKK
jgi:hypothetical protein